MAERFLREEIRTDYAGSYTAYLYADGHVETDPPGRPTSREDSQRERLATAAGDRAQRLLEAQQAELGVAGVTLPTNIRRASRGLASLRVLTGPYHETLAALGQLAPTLRAPEGQAALLRESIDIGGLVVGDRAGERPEYDTLSGSPDVPSPGSVRTPTYPTKLR